MQEHGLRPRARQEGLVVQELGDESLVYDRDTDAAHCLGAVAARVWRGCDGERDLGALAALTGSSEDLVADALDELREKRLLAVEPSLPGSPPEYGVSRRQALGKMAKYGAGAASIPLILSVTATTASAAISGGLCVECFTAGSTCAAGFVCDPTIKACIPTGCSFTATCTPNTCPVGQPVCSNVSCGHLCC